MLLAVWIYLAQPALSANDTAEASVDIERMQNVVKTLSINFHPRSYGHTDNLNLTADFIEDHFADAGGRIEKQEFSISGTTYYNIRCLFGPSDGVPARLSGHTMIHTVKHPAPTTTPAA